MLRAVKSSAQAYGTSVPAALHPSLPGVVRPSQGWQRWPLQALLAASIYWMAGRLAQLMAIPPGYATAVWPAAGFALICVLFWGRRVVPGVALGSFLVNIGTGFDGSSSAAAARSVLVASCIALGAGAQAALGAGLIRRYVGFPTPLETERDIARFALLGGGVSCLVSPTLGVTALCSLGVVAWEGYAFSWWTWWVGDAIGVLIFAPVTLLFAPSPHALWRQRRAYIGLPLLIGFAVVTVLFLRTSAWEEARLSADFERRAAPLGHALKAKLSEYHNVVSFLSSLFDASEEVNRAEFQRFTRGALEKYGGIEALEWAPRVRDEERARLEEAARGQGLPGFTLTERDGKGHLRRAQQRPEYVPVYYAEPQEKSAAALGFDLASDAARLEAIKKAGDSRGLWATARVPLLQGKLGVLLLAPAFTGAGAGPPSGYAIGVFRLADVIESAFYGMARDGLDVFLSDEDARGEDALLFATGKQNGSPRQWSDDFTFGGRRWRLEVAATAAYMAAHRSWQAWMVLAGGLLFVGLLGVVMLMTTGQAARAERMMEHARENGERFRALVDVTAQIVWTTAADGEVIEDSPSWRAFTGQSLEQWRGWGFLDAMHPEDRAGVEHVWKAAVAAKAPMSTEYRVQHVSGQWRWTAARAAPLLDEAGEVRGWVGMNADITERKRAEQERTELLTQLQNLNIELESRVAERTADLSKALKEREVLIQEIHHRVKNNLQVISSLINMQVRKLDPGVNRDAFEECQTRVQAIALIHEKLYRAKDYASVPFSEYARSLAATVFHATGVSPSTVALELEIEDLSLAVDRAIPCGLVLNELITNALKHGFKNGRQGRLKVTLGSVGEGRLRLGVKDDGAGLPEGLDLRRSESLGLQLVVTLAEQLDAKLTVSNQGGAYFQLDFPAEG